MLNHTKFVLKIYRSSGRGLGEGEAWLKFVWLEEFHAHLLIQGPVLRLVIFRQFITIKYKRNRSEADLMSVVRGYWLTFYKRNTNWRKHVIVISVSLVYSWLAFANRSANYMTEKLGQSDGSAVPEEQCRHQWWHNWLQGHLHWGPNW